MNSLWFTVLLLVFAYSAHSWTVSLSSVVETTKLLVSFTNDMPHKAHLLKWRTPFDELEGLYSFVVTKGEKQMEYKGPVALRLGPHEYDFVEFRSNQTRFAAVDLAEAFDLPEVGEYTIQLAGWEPHTGVTLTSNAIVISVTTASLVQVTDGSNPALISFRNCDASHRNIITPAWQEYGVASGMMRSAVGNNPQGAPLYRTWFGIYDNARFSHVISCITRLDDDFRANSKEFFCNPGGCSPGVVAYVTSGAPNTIHVCQLYFQLSNRDHIFVIVHEQMHFGAICGAPDYVYGRQGSQNLAISNPNNAVRNSDNYRFYGEDLYYGNRN